MFVYPFACAWPRHLLFLAWTLFLHPRELRYAVLLRRHPCLWRSEWRRCFAVCVLIKLCVTCKIIIVLLPHCLLPLSRRHNAGGLRPCPLPGLALRQHTGGAAPGSHSSYEKLAGRAGGVSLLPPPSHDPPRPVPLVVSSVIIIVTHQIIKILMD